jgi:hypothetical protein
VHQILNGAKPGDNGKMEAQQRFETALACRAKNARRATFGNESLASLDGSRVRVLMLEAREKGTPAQGRGSGNGANREEMMPSSGQQTTMDEPVPM